MMIALTLVILVGLIHGGYGMQREIIEFSLQFKGNGDEMVTQHVVSDPDENVVSIRVNKFDQDAHIIQDFSRGIQAVRIQSPAGTTCYVTPLDQSSALSPAEITGPDSMTSASDNGESQLLLLSDKPIKNTSFLTKKAADMCSGVTVFWANRDSNGEPAATNATLLSSRRKRTLYHMTPYNGLPGIGGCCIAYWACRVQAVEYITGTRHRCEFTVTVRTCCGAVAEPYCSNSYWSKFATPGLICN